MSIIYNGTTIPSTGIIKYNNTSLNKVIYNGTAVWQKSINVLEKFPSRSDWTVYTEQQYGISITSTKIYIRGGSGVGPYARGICSITSPAIDVTDFTNLAVTYSCRYWGQWYEASLKYSGGKKSLSSGNNDISSIKGNAQLYFFIWSQWSDSYGGNWDENYMNITKCLFS